MSLEELLEARRVEEVPVDAAAAKRLVDEAKAHLTSADKIRGGDPDGAYALLYDAARKAVSAHMLARGFRARNQKGAHQAVVLYAETELSGAAVAQMDRLRRIRNRSEYGVRIFGDEEIAHGLRVAEAIVMRVEELWPAP